MTCLRHLELLPFQVVCPSPGEGTSVGAWCGLWRLNPTKPSSSSDLWSCCYLSPHPGLREPAASPRVPTQQWRPTPYEISLLAPRSMPLAHVLVVLAFCRHPVTYILPRASSKSPLRSLFPSGNPPRHSEEVSKKPPSCFAVQKKIYAQHGVSPV